MLQGACQVRGGSTEARNYVQAKIKNLSHQYYKMNTRKQYQGLGKEPLKVLKLQLCGSVCGH